MKINEVEQLVGITKKNIRFYEDQKLIRPERNASNGYRDYSDEDVEVLKKIRLLRRLSVPIEDIRKVFEGYMSLSDCMDRHLIHLKHEERNLEVIMELSESLKEEAGSIEVLDAEGWLLKLDELERGGSRFMDVRKADTGKKKQSAAVAAAVVTLIILAWDLFILSVNAQEPAPTSMIVVFTLVPSLVVIGIVLALIERFREIEGGEEDEASIY